MNKDITYLIPRASDEILFNVAKDSIMKYTPAKILTCGTERTKQWGEAFRWLFENCPTNIGIFIDDDAFILRDITPLVDLIRNKQHAIVGFTSRISTRYTNSGYFQPNFMIFNIRMFKQEFGTEGMNVDIDLAKKELQIDPDPLFMYGISQKLRGKQSKDLSLRLSGNYKFASILSDGDIDYVLHLWYGAWRHRKSPEGDMSARDQKVANDFYGNGIIV